MGVVYGATDTWMRRAVALKLPRRSRTAVRRVNRQLRHEAAVQSLAADRHVCSLYDLTEHEGSACLVMERLRGESLEARLLRGGMSNAELIGIGVQIALALRATHAAGIVHQDVKPANIFVTRTGVVKVLDFGIATWIGGPSEGGAPTTGKERPPVLGSANYISPERLLRSPADPRSDLFSLGSVLYEMASGQLPFAAASRTDVILNVLEARPLPLRSLSPGRPAALAPIVHRLLARAPRDRYQSAADVAAALQGIAADVVH
jgi:serine/threonine protein kinase